MAVAVSAIGQTSTPATTQSWTHVIGANDTDLLVWVAFANPQATTYTATIDGVTITPISHSSTSDGDTIIMAHLANPTPGSHTITVTPSPALLGTGMSMSFTGSAGISATHPATSGNNGSPTASFASSATGGMCVAGLQTQMANISGTTTGISWIKINNNTQEGQSASVAVLASTGSSETIGWTISTGPWATIGVEVLPNTSATVPNIVGDDINTANTAVRAVGLTLGSFTNVSVSSPAQNGLVQTQSPTAGTSVQTGTQVTGTIGTYTPPSVTMPNIIGDTLAGATVSLTALGLVAGTFTDVQVLEPQNGLIQSQVPVQGTSIEVGSTVTGTVGIYTPPVTTILTTTIPNAITYVLGTLQSVVPTGTIVSDGIPRLGNPAQFIAYTGYETSSRAPSAFGAGAARGFFLIEEQYTLAFEIFCWDGGSSYAVTRDASLLIFEAFENVIRTDPSLGNNVRAAWIEKQTGIDGPSASQNGGSVSTITIELHCEAQI